MSATALAPAVARTREPGDVSPAAVFLALLRRDARAARRELPAFLVRTLMQPLLFVIVFGFLLPRMGFMQGNYTSALLPGVIAVSLAMSSVQAVALPMVQDFGWTKEIEDRLLAPVPISLIAIEKITAGALQGIVTAIVVLPIARVIMGPIAGLTLSHAWLMLLVMILGSAAFSALGLWMGTGISPQQIGLMFSVIIAPMIMFGCAYYPWAGLDRVPVLKWLVLVNPLVYVAEAMRGAMTPSMPHMSVAASLAALVLLTGAFVAAGLRSFRRRAMS
jgi:ABC-2 type transport system permease protein